MVGKPKDGFGYWKGKQLNSKEQAETAERLQEDGVSAEMSTRIAERSMIGPYDSTFVSPADYLLDAFVWESSEEGHEFWRTAYLTICAELDITPEIS